MNILDAEDLIKGLPDEALTQEAQMPSGQVPQFLVVSEIQRRTDMRKRYQAQQQEAMPSVKDQIVQEGIMGMMPQQPMGMPQGMPQQMPPQMPQQPMGMAQGGIARMSNGKTTAGFLDRISPLGADPSSPFAGATIRDQLDALLNSNMSYADVLAFVSRTYPSRPEAVSYIQAKAGQGEMPSSTMSASMIPEMREVLDRDPYESTSMIPEMREVLDREPYESKEARMPMLAGGSDIYKGPMVVRAADALGLFDRFKGEPEPERMTEPMASALARQFEGQYATPDLSQRLTAEMLTGAEPVPERMTEPMASALTRQLEDQYATPDLSQKITPQMLTGANPVPSRAPESLPRSPRGPMANMLPPEYDQGVTARRAGIGEFFGDLSDRFAEGRARDREFIARGRGRSSKPGLEPAAPLDDILAFAQQSHSDASSPDARSPLLAAGNVSGTQPEFPYTDYESVMNVTDRDADMDFSVMDDYFANFGAGDKSVQGNSPVQTQAEPPPKLDIDDILEQSQRMTQANMLMQLGAGIAGGDLSKGISAAGAAGMKGAQQQQALDIRKRLAEYQAGRDDIARGEKTRQFEKTFGLSEDKLDALIEQNASTTQRETLRTLVSLFEGEIDQTKKAGYASQIQQILAELRGEPMGVGGMQTGARSPQDILAQYLGT